MSRLPVVAVLALAVCATAGAATIPDRAQLTTLYKHDHHGARPTNVQLAPYSTPFQAILGACAIDAGDLANATAYMSAHAATFPGHGAMSNLIMLGAISHTVSGWKHRDCWNTFNVVERRIEAADAKKLIVYRRQITAMYVNDHNGRAPKDDVDLLPYSQAFGKIVASCTDSADDLPGTIIDLSDQATELGTRNVTAMMIMAAVASRIDWHGRRNCTDTYNQAEGHVEGGGS